METRTEPAPNTAFDFGQLILDLERVTGYGIAFANLGQMPRISRTGTESSELEPERWHLCDFCLTIKDNKEGLRACIDCDRTRGGEIVLNSRRPVFRRCHAGLEEVLIPVYMKGRRVGLLYGGQVRPKNLSSEEFSQIKAHWQSLGHDVPELEALYKALPEAQPESFQSMTRLLQALAELAERRADISDLLAAQAAHQLTPVQRALKWMADHYEKPITLRDAAKHVHLSPSRLSHLFTEAKGPNFRDRLIGLRMARAMELLSMTNLAVKEISRKVGYENPNFFCRIFRKKSGYSPLQYRDKLKQV